MAEPRTEASIREELARLYSVVAYNRSTAAENTRRAILLAEELATAIRSEAQDTAASSGLLRAAKALVDAWDRPYPVVDEIEALRAALAQPTPEPSLRELAQEVAKDWNGRITTGEDIRRAIAKACPLTNPRLSEVEWDEVAAALRLASREAPCSVCGSDWHYTDEHATPEPSLRDAIAALIEQVNAMPVLKVSGEALTETLAETSGVVGAEQFFVDWDEQEWFVAQSTVIALLESRAALPGLSLSAQPSEPESLSSSDKPSEPGETGETVP